MKRTVLFIPLVAMTLITAIVSCRKTATPSPSQQVNPGPQAYIHGGNSWNTLYYFGTPDYYAGCVRPCGMCHMNPMQIGYTPNTNDPENNEALAETSVTSDGHLLVSVDLNGVGNYYVNDIIESTHFNVAIDRVVPQELADAACDKAGVPHWGGPISVAAGNYPVHIEKDGTNSRLEMEGTYDSASGRWSWEFDLR